jgi:hypothetical protein
MKEIYFKNNSDNRNYSVEIVLFQIYRIFLIFSIFVESTFPFQSVMHLLIDKIFQPRNYIIEVVTVLYDS